MDNNIEGEDELSSPINDTLSRRVTPHQAQKRRASSSIDNDENETPYNDLRKLARTLRPKSTSATPDARTASRDVRPALGRYPRPVPAKRSAPSTPHAIRALEERRRAALTPNRERRRSGRQERDSPRNVLRALSRVLAEKKQAEALNIPPAAAREEVESGEGSEDDEVQDDFEADRPRLSLPIDQEQDDSFQLPPQISALLEDDLTQKSVEMPRRALADQFLLRDTARVSDIFVTPDRKSGVISHGSQRRASSPGFSFMVGNESIIQNNRQGDDTEDLRRLVFTGDGVSETDTPFESAGERSRNLEDSTFRFDIPLDIPVEETSDIEQLPGIQDEESKLDAPEIDVAQNDEPESEPELEAMLSSAADDTVPGAVSMKGPQAFRAAKRPAPGAKRKPKITKQSRYGIDVPSLPMGVVKGIASSFLRPSGRKKAKLNKDTVAALMQASDWFFEQVAEDLGAYSKHAGRKTIEEADVVTLMGRQRVLNAGTTPFSLAQKFLPRELLQELRMPPPNDEKKRIRRTRKIRYDVDEEDMNEDEDDEEEED